MISAISLDVPRSYAPLRSGDSLTVDQRLRNLCKSISTGVYVGVCNLGTLICVSKFLRHIPGIENVLADPDLAAEYMENNFFADVIKAPLLEEIIFRVVIQNFFHKISKRIVPDKEIEIFSCQLQLATLVAVVATSVLFGWAHITSGLGITHVILATISGLVLGVLKEKHGLAASISAHMINNAIICGVCQLAGEVK